MPYLIPPDYNRVIQDANLQQIITSNTALLNVCATSAEEEAREHLRQKYDVSAEIQSTNAWNKSNTYLAGNRVYLTERAYDTNTTYNIGDYTLYNGFVYVCNTNGTTGTFDPAKFTGINPQYEVYFAINPYPLFDLNSDYKVGDQVYWRNKTYTCLVPTSFLDHDTQLQYNQLQDLPLNNIFPDDIKSGVTYWGNGISYYVPTNTDITDTTFWSNSDNRDQKLVEKIVDITLYHLHTRITPKNVPATREMRYMGGQQDRVVRGDGKVRYPEYSALGWLQSCARGDISPNLPLIQPKQGGRIRYGGTIRNVNSY